MNNTDVNAEARLRGFAKLEANWDSYGAMPIHPGTIEAAITLLRSLETTSMPEPFICPTVNGGVQFEWHVAKRDLEIEVVSPTRFVVGFEDRASGEEWEAEVAALNVLDLPSLG